MDINTQQRQGGQAAQLLVTNPFLGLLPRQFWNRDKDFFAYVAEWLPIAPNGVTGQKVTVGADADFLVQSVNVVVTSADNLTLKTFAPLLLSVKDSGSGRDLMSAAVHIANLSGTGQQPGILPFPKILRASSIVSLMLTNLDGATSYNVRLALIGMKIFPQGASGI